MKTNPMVNKLILTVLLTAFASFNAYAQGDAVAGKSKSAICAACHGGAGISSIPINPILAGQIPGYIANQLGMFKSGKRNNAIMAGQVVNLSEQDMADLDAYYSSLIANTSVSLSAEDKALAEAGEAIFRGGFAELDIAACMSCHGPAGHGIPKNFPRVSAQHKDYLEQQLLAFKKGDRKDDNEMMSSIAFGLSELQIKQLAAYMAGLN